MKNLFNLCEEQNQEANTEVGSPELSLLLKNYQIPKFIQFFEKNRFEGQLQVHFGSAQQKQAFLQLLEPELNTKNDDFDNKLLNFQSQEDEEFYQQYIQPHKMQDRARKELVIYYPYHFIMRIAEFFKMSAQYAQTHQVELTLNRNNKVMMAADNMRQIDAVEKYLLTVVNNCDYYEMRKQRWEAIAINNTRSVISQLNEDKIGFTKVEENQDYFKLFFFWKRREDNALPEIVQYILNATFVSIKMIKNKKIQK